MLDFHTILLPKNRRTSKISRRQKGWNIRIPETEESHTFFFFRFNWDTVFRVQQIRTLGAALPRLPVQGSTGDALPSIPREPPEAALTA